MLAPNETGQQLLRLPVAEFIERCLQTDGVTEEQAKAFHAKLWQLHVDSQRGSLANLTLDSKTTKDQTRWKDLLAAKHSSSRDLASEENTPPFKERIRPGMVVRWAPPADYPVFAPKQNLAVVLCPQNAVGERVQDVLGNKVNEEAIPDRQRYLCALVLPAASEDAYSVSLWRQVVIDVDEMEAEVLLEYDVATRHYYIAV